MKVCPVRSPRKSRTMGGAAVMLAFLLALSACTGGEQKTVAPGQDSGLPSQVVPAPSGEAVPPDQESTPDTQALGDEVSAERESGDTSDQETSPAPDSRETGQGRPAADAAPAYQGEITFSTGTTALYRDGQVFRDLAPGTPVKPMDLLETGPDGQLEAEVRGPGVPGILVRISPRSQFYLENSLMGKNQSTTVHLLAGRAVLTVNKLLGGAVGVRTTEAALSVRGTVFTVSVAPTQDVLVTCSEGAVEVSRGGKKALAAPGKVVFHAPGEALDSLDVKVDKLKAFEDRWSGLLAQELEVLARIQLKDFARTFPQRLAVFESRYRELDNLKPTLDRWRSLAARNQRPDRQSLVMDKQVMGPTLLNLKKSLFFLERQVAWLLSLEGVLSSSFLTSDLDGRPVRTVMDLALSQKDYLQNRFSKVRYAMALFARMDPESPLGEFLTDLDQGEDLFVPQPGGGAKDALSR